MLDIECNKLSLGDLSEANINFQNFYLMFDYDSYKYWESSINNLLLIK